MTDPQKSDFQPSHSSSDISAADQVQPDVSPPHGGSSDRAQSDEVQLDGVQSKNEKSAITSSVESQPGENITHLNPSDTSPQIDQKPAKKTIFRPLSKGFNALVDNATSGVKQLFPLDYMTRWFSVSEDEVADILATVRAELPTTEAILIGKPQAGKSSIVRGLTGVSADIIGQGFRPHTQHTKQYIYPAADLPLLIFTDTVGLGDASQETQGIINELLSDLQDQTSRARIFILTVKINDFATDSLRHIAQQLRKKHPDIPCLLAITSLHEVYPADVENHPPYPPNLESVNRASQEIQRGFQGICDATVLIDFTLEEDEYTPVFYGIDTFRDTLANFLPEAEAKAIYRLLDERDEASKQLGTLYRDVGRRYIAAFSTMAATLAAVPLPFATMPVLTALQVSMIGALGNLYGQTLTPSQAGGIVSAIAGGFVAQAVGRELIKFIPGFGSFVAASWAAAYTWALGEGACVYFGDLIGGKKPDPERIQKVMNEAFESAKQRFKER